MTRHLRGPDGRSLCPNKGQGKDQSLTDNWREVNCKRCTEYREPEADAPYPVKIIEREWEKLGRRLMSFVDSGRLDGDGVRHVMAHVQDVLGYEGTRLGGPPCECASHAASERSEIQ